MRTTSLQLIGCTHTPRRLASSSASRHVIAHAAAKYKASAVTSLVGLTGLARANSSRPSHPDAPPPEPAASTSVGAASPAHAPQPNQPLSAAAFLLRQAKLEETEEVLLGKARDPEIPALRERGWDGDEPQERAIRRILEDTYKPLRVKGHKKALPQPAPLEARLFASPSNLISNSNANPEDPAAAHKKPWEYEFKAPISHQPPPASIRAIPRSRLANKVSPAARLATAREKSFDHRAGFPVLGSGLMGRVAIQVPVEGDEGGDDGEEGGRMGSMRNFDGFVEDKIQRAMKRGLFDKIEGRGKPLPKDEADGNPFIPRDDFLMNRIVKAQECSPPWVELQRMLETDLHAFRNTVGQDWVRRATRMLSIEGVTAQAVELAERGYRDPEWEAKERAFHEAGMRDLNDVVRRFNIIAPYAVRRPFYSLEAELERTFRVAQPFIAGELRRRLEGTDEDRLPDREQCDPRIEGRVAEEELEEVKETMWRAFKRVVGEILGKGPDPMPVRRRA